MATMMTKLLLQGTPNPMVIVTPIGPAKPALKKYQGPFLPQIESMLSGVDAQDLSVDETKGVTIGKEVSCHHPMPLQLS